MLGDEVAVMHRRADRPAGAALDALRPAGDAWVAPFVGDANLVAGTRPATRPPRPWARWRSRASGTAPCRWCSARVACACGPSTGPPAARPGRAVRVLRPRHGVHGAPRRRWPLRARAGSVPLFARGDRVTVAYHGPPAWPTPRRRPPPARDAGAPQPEPLPAPGPIRACRNRGDRRRRGRAGGPGRRLAGAAAGHEVTLLERARRSGHGRGFGRSPACGSTTVATGSTRPTPAPILAELRGLLGDDLQTRPRHGRIRLLDRWSPSPSASGDLLRRTAAPHRGPRRRRRRHRPTAPATGRHLRRGGAGRPRANGARRLLRPVRPQALGHGSRPVRRRARPPPGNGSSPVTSPAAPVPSGPRTRAACSSTPAARLRGQITEALAAAAVDAGADMRLASGARCRTTAGDRLVDDGDRATVEARRPHRCRPWRAWSTRRPVRGRRRVLAALRHPGAGARLPRARPAAWTEFDAHYLPGPDVVARVSEPSNYRDDADRPTDRTVLCAEVPCWVATTCGRRPRRAGRRLVADLAPPACPEPSGRVEVGRLPVSTRVPAGRRPSPASRLGRRPLAGRHDPSAGRGCSSRQHPPRPGHGPGRGGRGATAAPTAVGRRPPSVADRRRGLTTRHRLGQGFRQRRRRSRGSRRHRLASAARPHRGDDLAQVGPSRTNDRRSRGSGS